MGKKTVRFKLRHYTTETDVFTLSIEFSVLTPPLIETTLDQLESHTKDWFATSLPCFLSPQPVIETVHISRSGPYSQVGRRIGWDVTSGVGGSVIIPPGGSGEQSVAEYVATDRQEVLGERRISQREQLFLGSF